MTRSSSGGPSGRTSGGSSSGGSSSGRSRVAVVLGVLLGAALVLLATGRDWVSVRVTGVAGGAVRADGGVAAPGAVAVALVAAAGAVVVGTAGRIVRSAVAVLLILAGAGIAALSVPVWGDPAGGAAPAVARATGTVGAVAAGSATTTFWPAVSAAGGVVVAVAGAAALLLARRWPAPARRFERAGVRAAPGDVVVGEPAAERDRRSDVWDSLSRGEDPTAPDGGEPG